MCHLKVWWVGINDWSCYHQEESSSSPKRWQTCLSTKLHGMTCKKTANLLAININILVGLVVMSRRPCTGLDGVITRKTTSHRSSGCHDTPVPSTGQGPDAVPPSGRSAWRDSVMWQLQPFAPVTTYRGMYRIWERQFPHMPPPPQVTGQTYSWIDIKLSSHVACIVTEFVGQDVERRPPVTRQTLTPQRTVTCHAHFSPHALPVIKWAEFDRQPCGASVDKQVPATQPQCSHCLPLSAVHHIPTVQQKMFS
jgi:hypothetical protein